jgi:hypothetical protein
MEPRVVGLGAWCDVVTEDEFRQQLSARAAPSEVDEPAGAGDAEPRPALWRPRPDEIEAEVALFRRGASFRVVEFATLADGRRLTLAEDRGFGIGGPPPTELWAGLTLEQLESDVLTTVLPDEEDTEDEHPWEWLAGCLAALGVQASAEELRNLPYEVVFSERLRAKIPAGG